MTRPLTKRRTAGVIAAAMLALGGIATTAGAKPIDAAPVGLSVAAPPSQLAIIHHVDAQEAQRLPSGPPGQSNRVTLTRAARTALTREPAPSGPSP